MPNDIFQSELQFISPADCSQTRDGESVSESEIKWFATSARYRKCIERFVTKAVFAVYSLEDLVSLRQSIHKYLIENEEQKAERELEILEFGISCLQLFVVNNWTGPPMTDLNSLFSSLDVVKANNEILQLLEVDGEAVYALIDSPILLYFAMIIFQEFKHFLHCKTVAWWCLRYVTVHQQLLRERAPLLHNLSKSVIECLLENKDLDQEKYRSLKIQLHMEIGLLQLHYYQYQDAEKNFEAGNILSGIRCNFDGALGVRTRFQENSLPQLRVQIKRENDVPLVSHAAVTSADDIPKALPLNDDTLLESIKFLDENEIEKVVLTPEEQALLLMMCTNIQKTSPSHKLRDEQIMCIIEYLLSDPKSWCVHTEALRVRCNLQRHKSRTVERSMMQLESLVKNVTAKANESNIDLRKTHINRLSLFYSVWPKPRWILEKQLAILFESLGVLSSALEIYTRLHMWEEAILCLIKTGRGGEAEQIIRGQLAIKETPNLYCLLGDILQNPEMYNKAWSISNHRSARAMRSLGAYHISKKMYKESIECFDKSLAINYLQVGAWFSMGCAALADENYEKAAKAFQKCVSLNWNNFEAWTNLSTAFVRCSKKDHAYKALKEAIKCNFNRWELWENFLFVSADTGHFRDVINAYNRLLDLKDKYVETSALSVLVRAILEDIKDAYEIPASKQKPKALELFGRLTSKVTSDWNVWYLYSKLVGSGASDLKGEESHKALIYLQKALRSALQRVSWEKDEKSAAQTVDLTVELIDACLHCHQNKSIGEKEAKTIFSSIKLTIKGVVAKLQMQQKSLLIKKAKAQLADLALEVENKLGSLNEILASV